MKKLRSHLYEVLKVYNINKSKGMFLFWNISFDFFSIVFILEFERRISIPPLQVRRALSGG